MKSIIVIASSFVLSGTAIAQTIFEFGGQKNFIHEGASFQSVASYSGNAGFMLQTKGFPLYGGLTINYFYAKDKLLETNTFQQFIPGIKAGMRPLASVLMIPVQLFVEGYYNHSVVDKNPGIKSILGYGGGLEIYFSKRHAIALYYGGEQYGFATGEELFNSSARVSFRFQSK